MDEKEEKSWKFDYQTLFVVYRFLSRKRKWASTNQIFRIFRMANALFVEFCLYFYRQFLFISFRFDLWVFFLLNIWEIFTRISHGPTHTEQLEFYNEPERTKRKIFPYKRKCVCEYTLTNWMEGSTARAIRSRREEKKEKRNQRWPPIRIYIHTFIYLYVTPIGESVSSPFLRERLAIKVLRLLDGVIALYCRFIYARARQKSFFFPRFVWTVCEYIFANFTYSRKIDIIRVDTLDNNITKWTLIFVMDDLNNFLDFSKIDIYQN